MKTILNLDARWVVLVISLTTLLAIVYLLFVEQIIWKNNFGLVFTVISLVCTLILSSAMIYDKNKTKG
ncbi:hypothetical protein EGI31_22290 [Lacihabitans soyangensis]|uniref:Uncharacterized protein n=1 Tax=Lacihabitans soyangensis TaxID=869394 RepID=A0AAE3H7R4_9BACT|nr:hypothetical protein [Lacihabitans soyangensis]